MRVYLGNSNAIGTYTDDKDGKMKVRTLAGRRVTRFNVPDGTPVYEAFTTILSALRRHMAAGATPDWIESDDKKLRRLLVDHYGLQITKADRPEDWEESFE